MARKVDATVQSSPAEGWNMITGARSSHAASPANGVHPTGSVTTTNIPSGATSPGAVLGTGMNTDRYTPGVEQA